jgi:hypothetical protein
MVVCGCNNNLADTEIKLNKRDSEASRSMKSLTVIFSSEKFWYYKFIANLKYMSFIPSQLGKGR